MNARLHLLGAVVALTFLGAPSAPSHAQAQSPNQTPPALTGKVTSEAEGAMEGVVVSAKKADSNITVSVITDKEGRYAFPANRLGAGSYTIKIRAVGYVLDSPNKADVA